jgi:hypothetical protein
MVDGTANSLRGFCTVHKEALPLHWNVSLELGVLGKRQKFSSGTNLKKLPGESAGQKWSSVLKMVPVHCSTTGWCLEGEGLQTEGIHSVTNQEILCCDVTVRSPPGNWERPRAAPAWPVAMATQGAKQEEPGGNKTCLVEMTSQLSGV